MSGPELTGEDFSRLNWKFEHEKRRGPGRPSAIAAEYLRHAVSDLQFVLEQNWGEVGWLLREAKSIADVRNAFVKIVHQNCGYLEPFRNGRTRKTTPNELRVLRKGVMELEGRNRRNYARRQSAEEEFNRAAKVRDTESDLVKQGQLRAIVSELGYKFQNAASLEQTSRVELESLRAQLKESEAYFAQTKLLRFLESNRRKFTPKNVASAMAGLPHVTALSSCRLCAKYGIKPSDGIAFEMFQTIERMVPEPILSLGRSIDAMRECLLNGPHNDLPHAAQLRENWYFLESAIRSAALDTGAQRGSLSFRIFAEYSRTSASHGAAEAVLAQANRLLKDGEYYKLYP